MIAALTVAGATVPNLGGFMGARRMLGIGLVALTTALTIAVPAGAEACVAGGDQDKIHEKLTGPGVKVTLCPGALFQLTAPVRFTAPGQEITSELATNPATLRIDKDTFATAVDGQDIDGVALRNVVVDGAHARFGDEHVDQLRHALVKMGGASDQVVSGTVLLEPRGWTALHFFEGEVTNSVPRCQRAQALGNRIGPAGNPVPDRKWADGISLACGNSVVRDNIITDATDGGIVVFGAPGSIIENNTIIAKTREMLGGINLVDYKPMNGNYTGTVVRGNVIEAKSAFIKVGMAMGLPVWDCKEGTVHGATVTGNTLRGLHMGYGYAMNRVSGWTFTGNVDESRHVGVPAAGCGGPVSDPAGYQKQVVSDDSVLQPGFADAQLDYVLGVTEPEILKVGTSPAKCTWMEPDEALFPDRSQLSCDGRFKLTLQLDGNLVLTWAATGQPLWDSGTAGVRSAVALLQQDGNFVIYDSAGHPVWFTDTHDHPGARLAVQDDGNVVVYAPSGQALWAAGTGGHR